MLAEFQDIETSGGWVNLFHKISWQASQNASSQKIARVPENRQLNRYRDVLPYDHSRIVLKGRNTDYINANLVKVPQVNRRYILTQGPLPRTVPHFWQMVWEQDSVAVIMLNKVVEKNQIKCFQYWPCGVDHDHVDIMEFENFRVTYLSEQRNDFFTIRSLELENLATDEKRPIYHFHYLTWPDFGVPSSPSTFLAFLFEVRRSGCLSTEVGPPVLHCSAGIGRSGTFAMVDSILAEIRQVQDVDKVDVQGRLLEMRQYRVGLIQTGDQLKFTYLAILEGVHMLMPELYQKAVAEYTKNTGVNAPLEELEDETPPTPPPRKPDSIHDSTDAKRRKVFVDGFSSEDEDSDVSDEILDLSASISGTESEDESNTQELSPKHSSEESSHKEDVVTESTAAVAAAAAEPTGDKEELFAASDSNSAAKGATLDVQTTTTARVEQSLSNSEELEASTPAPDKEGPIGDITEAGQESKPDVSRTSVGDNETQAERCIDESKAELSTTADVTEENPMHQPDKPLGGVKETDEAVLRRRQREDRKRKTSELVENIKKKVKHEENSRAWKSSLKHVAIAVAVCSVAYLAYRYYS